MMVLSNVELYEALKGPIGAEAARMIANVVPAAEELVTKHDLAQLEVRLADRMNALESRMESLEPRIGARMASLESHVMGRLWVMFVPLWAGLYGLIATLLVRGG